MAIRLRSGIDVSYSGKYCHHHKCHPPSYLGECLSGSFFLVDVWCASSLWSIWAERSWVIDAQVNVSLSTQRLLSAWVGKWTINTSNSPGISNQDQYSFGEWPPFFQPRRMLGIDAVNQVVDLPPSRHKAKCPWTLMGSILISVGSFLFLPPSLFEFYYS